MEDKKIEIIGIDHGWSNMKTVSSIFTSGVKEITTEPALFDNVVEFEGKYFKVGGKRLEVKDTKVTDENYYILTLASIGRELNRRGLRRANLFLSVGLPLTRFGAEKKDFIDYLMKKKEINFKFENIKYSVCIERVSVFPQCYAAVADRLGSFRREVLVVDIGSWTIDIMPISNQKPDIEQCVTIPQGLITCMRAINEQCVRQLGGQITESDIQEVIAEEGKIGCQLIFSDIGTPISSWSPEGQASEFDIYNYVKTELVKSAIPVDEIAFIHDARTDAQREALFKDMRTGKKKILIGSTDKCGTGVNVQTHLVAMHHIDCPWKPSSIEQREGRGIRQGNENSEIAIYRYVTKGTFDAYSWSLVENKQRFISQVMTSKSISRTCEDIDEATLSYAEIKAVATGNPLMREKMELDNDVQRLKLLKASYDSQRYGLQDNFMIRFPKLIKAAEEKLSCVREDIRMRDEQLINAPQFAITIGKATLTERVDGGTAMLEAISKCKTGDTHPIGKFKGFELLAEKNYMGTNYMILRGKTEYKVEFSTSPVGNMVKLENTFNGLSEHEEFLMKKIDQYKRDMEQSKQEYEKPFTHETELKEKLARQFELNAQLDLENGKVKDVDLSGAVNRNEDVPDSHVAEHEYNYHTGYDDLSR